MKRAFSRKALSLILTIVLVLSLTATALAEGSSFAADNTTVALTVKTQVGDSTAATPWLLRMLLMLPELPSP